MINNDYISSEIGLYGNLILSTTVDNPYLCVIFLILASVSFVKGVVAYKNEVGEHVND